MEPVQLIFSILLLMIIDCHLHIRYDVPWFTFVLFVVCRAGSSATPYSTYRVAQ